MLGTPATTPTLPSVLPVAIASGAPGNAVMPS